MQTIYSSSNACAGTFTSAETLADDTYVHPSASTLHMASGLPAACRWARTEAGVVCMLPGLCVGSRGAMSDALGYGLSQHNNGLRNGITLGGRGTVVVIIAEALERFMLWVNQRQMKPRWGCHEERYPVDAALQRWLLALFFSVCPIQCLSVLPIIKHIFHIKVFQV